MSSSSSQTPLHRSSTVPGFSTFVTQHPERVSARKLVQQIAVRFAATPCTLTTREGLVHAHPGDAIITGVAGEQWRVSRSHFADKYRPVPPTVAGESGRYESLPNRIQAVQMNEPFQVLLADGISRLTGDTKDWLVDYGDGSLGIVSSAIFANTYQIIG